MRSPVERLPFVSSALGRDVFVKRDDLVEPVLGGTKSRKLIPLLRLAARDGVTDLVTIAAAGSNHVVASALHGRTFGIRLHAALVPHPRTGTAVAALKAAVGLGVEMAGVPNEAAGGVWAGARIAWLAARGRHPRFLAPSATGPTAVAAVSEAVEELAAQVASGELPGWPERIFCALGSGGICAALTLGLRRLEAPTEVTGVVIRPGVMAGSAAVALQAALAAGDGAWMRGGAVSIDRAQLGDGYGLATVEAATAMELFARDGIALDGTYSAKAAAALMAHASAVSGREPLLLWQGGPRAGVTEALGSGVELPAALSSLLVPS